MKITGKLTLLITAGIFAALPLLSQTSPPPKLSFDVISIRPTQLDREYGHEIRVVTEHIPADQSAIVFEYADGHMLRK